MKSKTITVLVICSIGIFTSCSKTEDVISSNNPFYIRGSRLLENGQYIEAAEAFRKCLRLTPETADAHLQLAMIHQDHLNNPIRALYHYRLFIEKGKDAKKVDMARQSLKKLKPQLADEPAVSESSSPPPAQSKNTGNASAMQRIKQLEKQKSFLLQKLKSINAQRIQAERHLQHLRSDSPEDSTAVKIYDRKTVKEEKSITSEQLKKEREDNVRVHKVQRGDTLIGLSRKYYKTAHLWDELLQYNNDILHGKTRLTTGMNIKIPAKRQLKR